MNKGLPSLLWNLYDNDGDHADSYFGAREANAAILDLLPCWEQAGEAQG